MSLSSTIVDRFQRSFALYGDLVNGIEEESLASTLPGLPSNELGLQLWCVVGARESYARAITEGEWAGFSCSLEASRKRESVAQALRQSADILGESLDGLEDFSDSRNRLVIDLLEHEAAHQGQIIRYLYGLRLPIPASWKDRYALS